MQAGLNPFTIGRSEELKTLLTNCKRGIPTLILGKAGLGKTHLKRRRPWPQISSCACRPSPSSSGRLSM